MIADLKPYSNYRESGLPWLGKVPEHWKQRRTKFLFRERVQKGFPEEPLLAATQSKGVVRKEEYGSRTVTATKDLHLLKLVEQGDYVISLRSFEGGIEVAYSRGIISPAYTVLAPQKEASQGYYTHFFKSPDFIRSLTLFVTGIREGQNIDYERLSRAYLPLPPSDEQAAIVRFLNWSNGQLEKAIRAKRKVITLLNEQKQAIIHRAVTRGLDSSVFLKPSGIPWLGDIPKHWEVRPIKHWTKINARTLGETTASNFQFCYIDISTVKTGYLIREPEVIRFDKAPSRARRVLNSGDTIVSTVRTYLKSIWFVDKNSENMIASTGFAVFTPSNEVEPEYLYYVLSDTSYVDQVTANSVGIAYPAIAETLLARFPVAISPSRHEQRNIISAIKDQSAPLTTAISRFEREIELLREYRTRLVADVVTGKLDVREAAAKLPDEALIDLPENDSVEALEDEPFEEEAVL